MSTLLASADLMPDQLKSKFNDFMRKIVSLGELLEVDLEKFQADHIAFRVNDENLAKMAKHEWSKQADVLSKAQINGRPIYVLQLNQSLQFGSWQIDCLELPFPAVDKRHPVEGWEHVEFVIPSKASSAQQYLQDLKAQLPDFAAQFSKLESLGVKVKLSSPKGEKERLSNPTIAFKWEGICIKFHPHALKKIIQSEA